MGVVSRTQRGTKSALLSRTYSRASRVPALRCNAEQALPASGTRVRYLTSIFASLATFFQASMSRALMSRC